jgi:ubiquinone/menaquinone biosynthesis C-methylase UbiE
MEMNNPKKMVEKVRDDYNLIAKEWDLSRLRPSQLKINLISDVEEGEMVLDIGCGNGLMVPYLLDKGAYYVGVDIAENLTDIAKDRYKEAIASGRVQFVTGEATELPVRDGEIDVAISFAVLHHLPSVKMREQFFSEIRRVLGPRGRVKITAWNLLNEWAEKRFDIGSQLEGKVSGDAYIPWKGTHGMIVNRYVHQFSEEELRNLAEGAGFSDIFVGYFNRAGEQAKNGEEIVLEMRG